MPLPDFTLEHFIRAIPPKGSLLGVDYGTTRCGLSITDSDRKVSLPLEIIYYKKNSELLSRLTVILEDRGAVGVVFGAPYHSDGSISGMYQSIKQFCYSLQRLVPELPILLWDERHSSVRAAALLGREDRVDAVAATLILEDALRGLSIGD